MALFPQMERVFWFDGQLKRGRYPNAARLAEKFEVSAKTAQRDIALLRDRLQAPIEYAPLLDSSFGLFQGRKPTPITLRFCPFRARWVRQQHWHPDQILKELPNGSLELTLPVADFREIRMWILQFGGDCEVVSPAALRGEIQAEIEKMAKLYRHRA
jgi:predicted DNA-binding transcriptional regulator YafY